MRPRKASLSEIDGGRFDVAVIGGGSTGAMVALDAASRGLSVVLLERDDYSQGTSSRSSKMIHGGLRYLESFDLGLVREALLERSLMVELAPHQVWPTPFLVPRLEDSGRDIALGVGLNAYDALASVRSRKGPSADPDSGEEAKIATAVEHTRAWSPERHRTISGQEAVELIPALEPLSPESAYLFYDCQTDDSRLLISALQEAERYGAVLLNGAEVVEVLEERGTASGLAFVESESGDRFEVRARNVVNATGVWADQLRPEGTEEDQIPEISPSRGTHITLSFDDLPIGNAACIIPAGEGRRIFALPWYGRALVGTTDNDYEGDIDRVSPSGSDLDYLLDAVNSYFGTSVAVDRIKGAFAGVRPLISSGDNRKSVDISRKAEMYETASGMLTITGGKWTTWRRMGKQVVDRILDREGSQAPCRTAEIPLGMPARDGDLDTDLDLPQDALDQLAFRYGHGAREVLDVAESDQELQAPILDGFPDLLAEVVIAARNEQARRISDVLLRRTRLGILDAGRLTSADSVEKVAGVLGAELGWSKTRCRDECERWVDEARREGIDPLIRVGG